MQWNKASSYNYMEKKKKEHQRIHQMWAVKIALEILESTLINFGTWITLLHSLLYFQEQEDKELIKANFSLFRPSQNN